MWPTTSGGNEILFLFFLLVIGLSECPNNAHSHAQTNTPDIELLQVMLVGTYFHAAVLEQAAVQLPARLSLFESEKSYRPISPLKYDGKCHEVSVSGRQLTDG